MLKNKDFPIHMEWNGTAKQMRFYIRECLRLDHYESTMVLLYTRCGTVRIGGQMLEVLLLEDGGVEIVGRVLEVSIIHAK